MIVAHTGSICWTVMRGHRVARSGVFNAVGVARPVASGWRCGTSHPGEDHLANSTRGVPWGNPLPERHDADGV
jgi:hypothetical protein